MGIYDREYYRDSTPRSFVGGWGGWSYTTWLIVINIAIYVLDIILFRNGIGYLVRVNRFTVMPMMPFDFWGSFSVTRGVEQLQLWRFVTYQFLHANLEHLAFNMFALYIFGYFVEGAMGSWRYLCFYLACGIAGAVAYFALWQVGILHDSPDSRLVGASASIFGVLVGAAMIDPDSTVLLYFFIPMRLQTLAKLVVAFAAYVVLAHGSNAGGQAAHLGGAALGFLVMQNPSWLTWFDRFQPGRRRWSAGPRQPTSSPRPRHSPVLDEEVDRILDKLHREGMDRLTAAEKETLERASRARRR